jgi:hypothetical protein
MRETYRKNNWCKLLVPINNPMINNDNIQAPTMLKARLSGKTNQCLQQPCRMTTRCIKQVARSTPMNKGLWQHLKTKANMEEEADLGDQVINHLMELGAWTEWFTKHSLKVISWRQQTFIHNLKRKETSMKIDYMLKLVLIKQNLPRSKNNTTIKWRIILMRCTE